MTPNETAQFILGLLALAVRCIEVTILPAVIFMLVWHFRGLIADLIQERTIEASGKGFAIKLLAPSEAKVLTDEKKKELQPHVSQWRKDQTGHLYWFASDLTYTIGLSGYAPYNMVKHYTRQVFWHATQLGLPDTIIDELQSIYLLFEPETEHWAFSSSREVIQARFVALLHEVAFIAGGKGEEFPSDPPADFPSKPFPKSNAPA